MEKLLLRVDEVAEALDIGRTRVFDLMRCGELTSVKIGGSRRIPAAALHRYIDGLVDGARDASETAAASPSGGS